MDLKKALNEYSFENVTQFRTIAKQLGYSEEYNRGNFLFTKGDEKYKTSVDEIRSHIKEPALIESLQNQSKERVSKVLERDKINDPKHIKELSEKYNIGIVKTKDKYNGLVIIDNENKVSYRGKSLYDYAFMNGYMLDGREKLEKNVMSGLREINGRQAKLRYDDNGIAIFYKKESMLIPDSIFGKKLTAEQKNQLKNGETILFKGKNNIFLQLDKELNAVVVRTSKELPIPEIVGKTDFFKGYELTPMDRYLLANGKSIDNKLMAGKDGYFVADFSMSPDKKGVIFSNIQNVSKEIAEQMISSQKEQLKNAQDDKTVHKQTLQEHNLMPGTKYERTILADLKGGRGGRVENGLSVDSLKSTPAMEVIKRHGLERQFNAADKALQEHRSGIPSVEKERKVNEALNILKRDAGQALDKFDQQLKKEQNPEVNKAEQKQATEIKFSSETLIDIKEVKQEQPDNTHIKEGKDLEFKDAIQKNDFIKITSLKNEGYKPSENLLKDMQQSGSITKEQTIAVEKIFDLKPENKKTVADVKLAEKTPSRGNAQNLTDGVSKTINNMFNDL
jgi:hypothetical protein